MEIPAAKELRGRVFQHNTQLFRKLFTVSDGECDTMLDKLAERQLWDREERSWMQLPIPLSIYDNIHDHFCNIANAVAELDHISTPRQDGMILVWRNTSENLKRPTSYWNASPTAKKVMPGLYAELKSVIAETGDSSRPEIDEHPSWNRFIIPGEFKQRWQVPVVQLAGIVRQILKEQPDRRFLFGFTYARTVLTVWHFDRSGVLGSEEIDVHKVSQ